MKSAAEILRDAKPHVGRPRSEQSKPPFDIIDALAEVTECGNGDELLKAIAAVHAVTTDGPIRDFCIDKTAPQQRAILVRALKRVAQ